MYIESTRKLSGDRLCLGKNSTTVPFGWPIDQAISRAVADDHSINYSISGKRGTVHQSNETLDHEMGRYLASHVKPSQARPGQAPNSHNGHSPHYRDVHAYMCCRLCT